jgi:hypothetical protein
VKANDKLLTYRAEFNEPIVIRTYFRVATSRGDKQGVASTVTSFDIDPFTLPPDPGEAGKQTLEGIDTDNDGLRDDVQRYIALSQPNDQTMRSALRQTALANQKFILSADDADSVLPTFRLLSRANGCLGYLVGLAGMNVSDALTAEILNTKARSLAYATANDQLSGEILPALDFASTSCDPGPASPFQ